MPWFAIKWILIGTIVFGVTIGAIISSNTPNGTVAGCDALQNLFNPSTNSNANANDNGTSDPNSGDQTNSNSDGSNNSNGSDGGTDNANGSDGGTGNTNGTDGGTGNTNGSTDNGNANGSTNSNTNSSSNANSNGSGTSIALSGTFGGTVNSEISQSLNGTTSGTPRRASAPFSIEFDSNGRPNGILVYGFADARDQTANVRAANDRATLTSAGTVNVTLTVRVSDVQYSNRSMRMVLALTYRGTSGNLNQTGTGTQTIDVSVTGDEMSYSVDVEYMVRQTAGSISFDTGETQTYTGTLNRQ